MSIFDKRMSKEERKSLELAEDSRESEWKYPSFAARLFQGKVEEKLVFPFPEQSREDKEKGNMLLAKIEKLLTQKLNPDRVDETREIPQEVMDELFEIGAFAMKIPEE